MQLTIYKNTTMETKKETNEMRRLPSFVRVTRARRRTVRISIGRDLLVHMAVPQRMAERDIVRVYYEKEGWVATHFERMRQRVATSLPSFTEEELWQMKKETERSIAPLLTHYAAMLGVQYCRVTVRRQRSRYGSCSSKRNLNFNVLLSRMPPSVREYVVVHELCHLKHMNHSAAFWAEVGRAYPAYEEARAWLKEHGAALLDRLP